MDPSMTAGDDRGLREGAGTEDVLDDLALEIVGHLAHTAQDTPDW